RAPEPAPEPAAEAAPELPAIPPPSMETAESAPPAPPAAPEQAAPAPQVQAPAPESEQTAAAPEPEQLPASQQPAETTTSGDLAPPPPPQVPVESQPETTASDLPEAPQTAALTPGPEEGLLRLSFGEDSADLNEAARESLRALAKTLLEDGNARVQLLAYASSADDSASRARRLSLSRALAVRAFLIDQGVRSTRMDVRALGSKSEGGPADRVDILPAQR
ncbi:MAG: OmpA family protein, partial [Kiloniellales bacterium]